MSGQHDFAGQTRGLRYRDLVAKAFIAACIAQLLLHRLAVVRREDEQYIASWVEATTTAPVAVQTIGYTAGVLLLWLLFKALLWAWEVRPITRCIKRLFLFAARRSSEADSVSDSNGSAAASATHTPRATSSTAGLHNSSRSRRASWLGFGLGFDVSKAAQDMLRCSTSGAVRMANAVLGTAWTASTNRGSSWSSDSWSGINIAAGTEAGDAQRASCSIPGEIARHHSSIKSSLQHPTRDARRRLSQRLSESLRHYLPDLGCAPGQAYSEAPEHNGLALVLYVDKNAIDQSIVSMLLEQGDHNTHRFKVASAPSGQDALHMVFSSRYLPDVVLIDTRLPDMNVSEVCRIFRNSFSPVELPIVLVTGHSGEADALAALDKGVNDFLLKPLRQLELLARINSQLMVKQSIKREAESRSHYDLLVQVLPPHIIARLAQGQAYAPEQHEQVTILFSDIVGFTNICSEWPTQKVVMLLDLMFSLFDDLCDKHNVFKVETIGDAYMVASGHEGSKDHALRMAAMAVDMLDAVRGLEEQLGTAVRIRIGMHTGPALSGVVGKRRPRYCFFGDTVNTASRMESTGFAMAVQISHACRLSLIAAAATVAGATAEERSSLAPDATAQIQRRPAPVLVPEGSAQAPSERAFFLSTSPQQSAAPLSPNQALLVPSRRLKATALHLFGRQHSLSKTSSMNNRHSTAGSTGSSKRSSAEQQPRLSSEQQKVAGNTTDKPAAASGPAETVQTGSWLASDSYEGDNLLNSILEETSGSHAAAAAALGIGSADNSGQATSSSGNCGEVATAEDIISAGQSGRGAARQADDSLASSADVQEYPGLPWSVVDLGYRCVKGKGCMKTHMLKVGEWKSAVLAVRAEQADQGGAVQPETAGSIEPGM